jgi:hypothetical protein
MRSFSLPDRVLGWLLPVLAIVAEGALLAVIYVAVQVIVDHRVPLLGTFELAAAAGAVAFATRRRWIQPDEDALPFLAMLALLGVIGWLWDDSARALALDGAVLEALAVHPGGWLMVVAGMRGVGRAFEVDDRAVTRLVLGGVPALAIPWGLGQLSAGDLRPVFTDQAFVASITFVTAGFIAAGLARLQEIGRETGVDWRHDRSWMSTVLGVIVVVLALGIPASILLGLPGDAVARGILDPMLAILGYLFVGFATLAALGAVVLATILRSFGIRLPPPMTAEELAGLQEIPTYTIEELRGALTGLTALWVALVVVGIVLVRVWMRRRRRGVVRVGDEERSFRLPGRSWRQRRPRLPRPSPAVPMRATDAVTAYLASIEELAAHDAVDARAEHETPRAHATRVAAGRELGALQADYALARYGGRTLSDAEHRRAVGRWRRLRERLRGLH